MKRKIMLLLAVIMVVTAFSGTTAFARDIDNFTLIMGNSNESDTTGVYTSNYDWSVKSTTGRDAAISCSDYTNNDHNFKTALFKGYSPSTDRVTYFAWSNAGDRDTPGFFTAGISGASYIIYGRRDDREDSSVSTATGTYASDEY